MSTKSIIQALGLLIGLVVAAPLAAQGATSVGAGHTGHWYDPARSGEGWVLEILDPQRALVYWFTYDDAGNQRWLVGEGQVTGRRIEFPRMVVTSGGRHFSNFDPSTVVRKVVGSMSLEFDDCDSGSVTYDAFGVSQTLSISRLTATSGLGCGGGEAGTRPVWQTGSWFDPANDGEGFSLQWTSAGKPVLAWFTYDQYGAQRWIIGPGESVDGYLWFKDLTYTSGGRFGPSFDPASVQREPWGEAMLTLDCEGGSFGFDSMERAGYQRPVRLTGVHGLACPSAAVDFDRADWTALSDDGPQLSGVASARLGDSAYLVGGLNRLGAKSSEAWRFDLSERTWSRIADLPSPRNHGMMVAHQGALFFFGGYQYAMAERAIDVWRYSPGANGWTPLQEMPARLSSGTAVSLGDFIYIVGAGGYNSGSGRRDGDLVRRFDPKTGQWTEFTVPDIASRSRFRSAAVAFEGKIWLLGGSDHHSGNATDRVTIIDPENLQAVAGPPMTRARSGHSAVVVDGQIVVAGGVDGQIVVGGGTSHQGALLDSAEVYSPQHGAWRQIASMPARVKDAGIAGFHNKVFVMLGATAGGASDGRLVQVLEPKD